MKANRRKLELAMAKECRARQSTASLGAEVADLAQLDVLQKLWA